MESKASLYNFSWIEENVIAGSSYPEDLPHFDFLLSQGIKVIINLTERYSYPTKDPILENFIFHQIPVKDFTAPSQDQLIEFQNLVKKYQSQSMPILVHCIAGCGRTGTFLASYLIYRDKSPPEKVLRILRSIRPCSVESKDQENSLESYYYVISNETDI